MTCARCGAANDPEARFCEECGGALSDTCPTCGAAVKPGARFCRSCGTALVATSAPVAPAPRPSVAAMPVASVAERRLVTVLFADLVGSTALAEGRDPEETRELLGRYIDLARDVIARYGGTIEKFIGDAVMAVWGAPVAREDDAERAVRAALELIAGVPEVHPGLQARGGVLTGEAAVTIGAVGQGMVAGDLVNTAARLQSAADPGSVWVGEATQRATSASIAFESVGAHTVSGKALPVAAWRALRIVAEVGGRNRAQGLEAPFVGREEELRLLKELFHATGREQRARLVSVIGPGGIGKSRLTREFSNYADGLVEPIWWHEGRSPAYGEGITFWALGDMVRYRCGLLQGDDDATSRRKVRETIARFVTDEDERRWIEVGLLALLGVGDRPPGGSDELFASWRTFFERIAAHGTTALVFEDLHWADAGLLDFIDHVLDWTRGVPLYIVTLARPELLERRPDWGAGKRNFTSISLEPLADGDMRSLLAGLAPGLPQKVVAAVVGRADGIPLYAVEMVRMLVAQGRLVERDGVYQPVGEIDTLDVPETLIALIAARLDGLPTADRALLQDAAVLGQSFTVAGLEAVSGSPRADIDTRLASLVRREVLERQADPRSPERGQFAFVQALIREVAYNTLARADRRARHLAAARYFESLGGEELAGALAAQYLAAYRSSPDGAEADALATQARLALRAAGERAAALGSPRQAIAFFQQTLEITAQPVDQSELLERIGSLAGPAGLDELAEVSLDRAISLRRTLGHRPAMARATYLLGRSRLDTGHPAGALEILEPAEAEFRDLADDPAVIALGGQLARAYALLDQRAAALTACDRVLAAAEHTELVEVLADTLVTRGTVLMNAFRYREGIGTLRLGIAIAEEAGLSVTALRGANNLAAITSETDPRAALQAIRGGLTLARRLGSVLMEGSLATQYGFAAYRTGDWESADGLISQLLSDDLLPDIPRARLIQGSMAYQLAQGRDITSELDELRAKWPRDGGPVGESGLQDTAAVEAWFDGRLADARTSALASNAMAPFPSIVVLAARCAIGLGDLAAARSDLATFESQGAHGPVLAADRSLLRGGIAALSGEADEAVRAYRDALGAYRALGLRWDVALCALDMIEMLPDEAEARDAADDARVVMEELGAVPFLARIDAALARSRAGIITTA